MPDEREITEEGRVCPEWLCQELRSQERSSRLLILDCRAHLDFVEAHIRGSVSLAIPSIMLRRLAAGKVDLLSTIRCLELRSRVEIFLCGDQNSRGTFILIGDSTEPAGHQGETIQVLSRRLRSCGGSVATLIGEDFHNWFNLILDCMRNLFRFFKITAHRKFVLNQKVATG